MVWCFAHLSYHNIIEIYTFLSCSGAEAWVMLVAKRAFFSFHKKVNWLCFWHFIEKRPRRNISKIFIHCLAQKRKKEIEKLALLMECIGCARGRLKVDTPTPLVGGWESSQAWPEGRRVG